MSMHIVPQEIRILGSYPWGHSEPIRYRIVHGVGVSIRDVIRIFDKRYFAIEVRAQPDFGSLENAHDVQARCVLLDRPLEREIPFNSLAYIPLLERPEETS